MMNPESFSMHKFIERLGKSPDPEDRNISLGLSELYDSGKYGSLLVPERDGNRSRIVEATHMVMIPPDSGIKLVPHYIDSDAKKRRKLDEVIRRQLNGAYSEPDEVDDSPEDTELVIQEAVERLQQENLHVYGAFQVGLYIDGMRSAEIFYPRPFISMFESVEDAATLSAAFLKALE